ncbi:alpha-xenorhabdolysin family binary toxin subunit A [Pseudomonas sp. CCI2.4]|uniref:alpha-xenorhabdolysin family binary toxin subunit A n=1 Tax=Pseudomonas sp. CCI2.4 TaxID=3048617 RepID=UPI002B22A4DC|nr:alpha-xenorhabdolysin family binary toxin subunit A [Pseudomonas sp. CCI2.4]MEB0129889.1 alpha-xenorhabdolysin family binary toxin subunit A [Pseudomonas sp. CCI2.4]
MNQAAYDDDAKDFIDDAINAPKIFINASAGRAENSTRGKGVALTKAELVQLRLYEIAGLQLPTDLKGVENYLNFETYAGPGLLLENFQHTFTIVHNHAKRWNPICVKIKAVGSELKVFAGHIVLFGKAIANAIDEIKGNQRLSDLGIDTVEDLMRVQAELGPDFPDIGFDSADKEAANDFGHFVKQMLKKVEQKQKDAQEINQLLFDFDNDLSLTVRPEIHQRLQAISNTPLTAEIKSLAGVIEQRALDIDEKTKEYKKAVEDSLKAASSLNVYGLGMAIYIGVEAEKIRTERNRLKALQEIDIGTLGIKDRTLYNLNRVKLDMQDLELLVIDADTATKNLITVWNAMSIYANKSLEEANEIDDAMKARLFAAHFGFVVEPWVSIGKDADALLDVFREADDEIKSLGLNNN